MFLPLHGYLAQTNATEVAMILGLLVVAAAVVVVMIVKKLTIICEPNEVVVLSGRSRIGEGGEKIGYRVIKGGRALRIPIIESASRMDLTTIPLEVMVTNAYSKGGIPLTVQGIANVKICSHEPYFANALERFLGVPMKGIQQIAKETLEGNLRGVLATLTPEEVNEDRLKFAQRLLDEAEDDLNKLGLQMDTLKIQNVSDEVSYLDSIGRKQTAEVIRQARVAEAERRAEAEEKEAEAKQRADIARARAEKLVAEEENILRERRAELEAVAIAKEMEAKVAGEKAKVKAEQAVEHERIELQQRRLEADVVAPARAAKQAKELEAQGDAAKIIEAGKAQVDVLQRFINTYLEAGPNADKVFILQQLPDLMESLVSTVRGVKIDKVTVIDSGNGQGNGQAGIPSLLSQLPGSVIKINEQIENATGIDILSSIGRRKVEVEEKSEEPTDSGDNTPGNSRPAKKARPRRNEGE
ncbi:MAG: SPFH domain-containing protein [Planctomycetota bacterium]